MLQNLTVRKKLLAIAGLVVVAMLAIGLFVRSTVTGLAATSAHMAEVALPALEALAAIDEQVALVTANVRGLSVPWLVDRRAEVEAALRKGLSELRASEQRYDAMSLSPGEREAWTALKPKLDEWVKAVELVAPLLVAAADGGEAAGPLAQMKRTAFVAQMQRAHQPVEDGMRALAEAGGKAVQLEAERARGQAAGAVTALMVLVLLAGAVTVGTMLLVSAGITRALAALVVEASKVSVAVGEGRIDVRGDAGAIAPEFQPIIEGLNATADAFAAPIRVTARYVARIGQGDIPPKITDAYAGDFNTIKASLNDCIDAVDALVSDTSMLAKAGVEGRLATRADASKHQGDFRKVVQGVNDTLDAVINPLNVAAKYVDLISKGNIPPKITDAYAGDFNTIKENLNRCVEAVNKLVADAGALAQAGVEGRLATRADASKHEGDFRKIVEGVNKTLDAVIGPLNVAARYVDEISRGAIPQKITDSYAGDFNTIKNNLNTCIDAVNRLVADAGTLVDAAVAGRLTTRADASKHQGDFKKIVEGVNKTLDAVLAPITEAAGVLEKLAQRDLRARVAGSYQGDHARIKDSLNATGEALEEALSQVAAAVEQVSSASQQIASSSQAVASGASEQAASLEETGSSLESVSAMTRQAADNASQANTLATTASAAAAEGASVVAQMQSAMVKIRASAEGTSQIIKDINDIAFQTNLLALNAAVEAARAGEAGRGFAVVAEEVRSLALRAKEAATKTEELIKESVKQAGEGEVTSRQVAGKLGEIVTGITKVSGIVSEIAAAAREQTSGIDQVNKAVIEMDKVTQQNAASAEQSSSAASELNGQAEELAAMVGAFQLTRGSQAGGARRPASRAAPPPARPASLPASRTSRGAAFPMGDEAELREF